MKFKKISISILFILIYILVLSGCGNSNTPKNLWNRYIKAMNTRQIEKVAEVYYDKGSAKYNTFLENNDETYFADLISVETESFEEETVNDKYFSAYININIEDGYGEAKKDFHVYFYKDIDDRWKFVSEVEVISYDITLLGNKPDTNFYNSIIKTADGFRYKYVYGQTPGVFSNEDYIRLVNPLKNSKIIIIPEMIEGAPVKIIGEHSFQEYLRILSVTFPTSKLEEIKIPETVTTIENYAFHQAKNLQSITIPKSVKSVGNYAFANSGLETMRIEVDESAMYGNLVNIPSRDSVEIVGNSILYVGEIMQYKVNGASVTWSSDNEEIATVDNLGNVTPKTPGTVNIIATNELDNSIYSKALVTIFPVSEKSITSTASYFVSGFSYTIKSDWYVGDTETLRIRNREVTWQTSDPNIASIDNNGLLTANSTGQVTVTATSTSDSNLKASVTINIKDKSYKYAPVSFSEYDFIEFTGARNMFVDDYLKLQTEGYEPGEILWSSDDESVATVSIYEGEVIARSSGTVVITATLKSNPLIYSSVSLFVSEANKIISFGENSLDRLYNLKELYINAINPHSVFINGKLKLPSDTKIYVPEQNIKTYKTIWAEYQDQIYPMP